VGIKLDESNALQASRNERWKPVGGLAALALLALLITRRWQAGDFFAGKVVVITGGSRGLGLALARRLVQAKARVAILSRDQEELEKARRDLLAYGPPVTTWQIDVKDDQAVSSTIEKIATALGGIDALINNAGEIVVGPLEAMNRKDRDSRNLTAHFFQPGNRLRVARGAPVATRTQRASGSHFWTVGHARTLKLA
jgi:NAD(P)-dependent dehydrogenase (short-subunit alcohol dehydrogenase family)